MPGVIFRSTGAIINLLEKVVKARFHVSGLENIPDAPCLFVANHFTRAETFILPYVLYKYKKRKVRSLADEQVFVGALGKYLKSVGTISTAEPKRNKIILSDLIIGKRDWLIYPEGVMVKNKNISIDNNIFLDLLYKQKTIHTGAAVLALKAELLKKNYLMLEHKEKYDELAEFKKKYLLDDFDTIDPKSLNIVPVSISYFPIRPGDNAILQMTRKFVANMPERILEELEIEGSLILNSEVSMDFQKPVNVGDYIKTQRRLLYKIPTSSLEFQNNLLIKLNRFRLIKKSMIDVYMGISINFDHIFAALIGHIKEKDVDISTFKDLFYKTASDIKGLKKYNLHPSIDINLAKIFSSSRNEYFDSVLKLAQDQGVVIRNDNRLEIKKEILFAKAEFHSIRIKNSLKVLLNEVSMFKDIIKIVVKNSSSYKKEDFKNNVADTIEKNDIKGYFSDYKKYYLQDESKDRQQGEPFYLSGKKDYPGIILSHGYKASPLEVKDLAFFLNKKGYHVYAVRLKGHATAPLNLKYTCWEDWYISYLKGYAFLKQKCPNIIAAGFSTGGLLALLFAAEQNPEIKAVISINSALKIKDIKVNFVPGVHFWNELVDLFSAKKGKMEFVIDTPENPHINYAKNYLRGVSELTKLMGQCEENLKYIKIPTLVVQGDNDPVVNPKSGDIIYKKISSAEKKLYKPKRDKHVIILGEKKDRVFSEIVNFIDHLKLS